MSVGQTDPRDRWSMIEDRRLLAMPAEACSHELTSRIEGCVGPRKTADG